LFAYFFLEATKPRKKPRSTKLKKKIIFPRENVEYNEFSCQLSYTCSNDENFLSNAWLEKNESVTTRREIGGEKCSWGYLERWDYGLFRVI